MSTTATLTISSIKMFVRNRQALFFTLFTPLIIMAIFGLIGFDRIPKTDIGVVTSNPNAYTQQFINQLSNISSFNIHRGSIEQEAQALDNGERALVLTIPDDFIPANSGIRTNQPKTITAFANVGQQQQAQTALSVLNQILNQATLATIGAPALYTIQTKEVNSRNLKYIDFLLPGIVALAIMQMAVFSVAFVFADYKEKGVLKRLLATPMKPFQFVTANVITRLIIALIQAAILIAVGVLVFKAHVIGSYPLIFLTAALGGIMFLGLGFTISGLANTVETVPALANLVVFPMLFLGGTFFPLNTMPNWLQKIAEYLPLTYFSHALRQITTRAAGLGEIKSDLLWMLGWSAVLVALAIYTFRFEGRRV